MKKLISVVFFAFLFLTCFFIEAHALSTLEFTKGDGSFRVSPGSAYGAYDLFPSFKGLLPGDVRSEDIVIKNSCEGKENVKLFLRAKRHGGANPISPEVLEKDPLLSVSGMEDFLSKLNMKVTSGSELLFEGDAKSALSFTDPIFLGDLPYGKKLEIRAELSVPKSLGNEYQDAIGETDWVFLIEENKDFLIQTGYSKRPCIALSAAGLLFFFLYFLKKKRRFFALSGAVLICTGVISLAFFEIEERNAARFSDEIFTEISEEIEEKKDALPAAELSENKAPEKEIPTENEDLPDMKTVEISGNSYIGYITLPTLKNPLPVMSSWSYEKLKKAPARQFGSTDGGLVIAGHNYKKHFGSLGKVNIGDTISFTDAEGKVFSYEVTEKDTVESYEISKVKGGDSDLILYTCTPPIAGAKKRVVVGAELTGPK